MLFVICRNGVPVKSFSEPMHSWDKVVNRLKLLYIQEQSQEIYVRSENQNPSWFKVSFKFKLYPGGMHPEKAAYDRIEVNELPKQVQIQHLMGAL